MFLRRLVNSGGLLVLDPARGGVLSKLQETELFSESPKAFESAGTKLSVSYRTKDGATRLALMATVPEPAIRAKIFDVLERIAQTFVGAPECELSNPRVIDQQTSVWEQDELAMRGRVLTSFVPCSDFLRP